MYGTGVITFCLNLIATKNDAITNFKSHWLQDSTQPPAYSQSVISSSPFLHVISNLLLDSVDWLYLTAFPMLETQLGIMG